MRRKPLDVGNGVVCASFGADATWLSMLTAHPAGLVELTAAPPFPVERDGDAEAVRSHRASLLASRHGILRVNGCSGRPGTAPYTWRLVGAGWRADTEVVDGADPRELVQEHTIRPERPGGTELRFRGRLDRPGYAEITPGGPIPPSFPATTLRADGPELHVVVDGPDVRAQATVRVAGEALDVTGWRVRGDEASLRVTWPGTGRARLTVGVRLVGHETGDDLPVRPLAAGASPRSALPVRRPLDDVEAAALKYTLGCTALETGEGRCCILTDHRLLPLSWTRDAYYQAALLLAHRQDVPDAVGVVGRHLAWLFGPGRDESGVWRRSHLATGAVKDSAYQVDQQLYPLIELADWRRTTGRWPGDPATWGRRVRLAWDAIPRDDSCLVAGEENPADDPAALPYLLSSQLLLAHTATRLAEVEDELGLGDLGLAGEAARVLQAVRDAFTCEGPYGEQWAYETDAAGRHRLYHDANDVPTALAPLWGVCAADDPQWRATMRFAFSPHNPAYVAGVHGGLGSAHTPGVWPLGDAQEWAVAAVTGDAAREAAVTDRLARVAGVDAMLPETCDPGSGGWLARHWFAWPGSLVGLLNAHFAGRPSPWRRHGGDRR